MQWSTRRMLIFDAALVLLAGGLFVVGFRNRLKIRDGDLFQRIGAILVLLGATISLNVQKALPPRHDATCFT